MAEGQDLSLEFNPRSEAGANGGKEGRNARAHIGTLSAETGKLNRLKKYRVSTRDNSDGCNVSTDGARMVLRP